MLVKFMRFTLLLILITSQLTLIPPIAKAGGGCGSTTPTISTSVVKAGESFYVDFSYIQYDSDINYADPKIAPEVNFSSSLAYLQQQMIFKGLDTNNWAQYRATFQIPSNFIGNQNLQAILIYPSCEGTSRAVTHGPGILIQSSSSIPTCKIEDLQVNDYSVKVGEDFKVGFKVLSSVIDLKPTIELTDSTGKKIYQARLAGSSGSDLKVYEATISYTQAYQYNYGAIARVVVDGLCNSSGQRQVIGVQGYTTSMAILQPIYPGLPCEVAGSSIITRTSQLKDEELFCTKSPHPGNTSTWMKNIPLQKPAAIESCTKLNSMKNIGGDKFYCILSGGNLIWENLQNISLIRWREASEDYQKKYVNLKVLISQARKSSPEKSLPLDSLWKEFDQNVNSVPEDVRDTFDEYIYLNSQIDKYTALYLNLVSLQSVNSNSKSEITVPTTSSAAAKKYKNCTELNKVHPGGVALPGAINTGATTKQTPKYDKKLYDANKKSDRDKDGIACEK